jgi:hypothetical protein
MSMLITMMKYVAIVALLAGMFWRADVNLRIYLDLVITAGTLFAVIQGIYLRKYVWVAAFGAIVCIFNPLWPIEFSFNTLIGLQIMAAAVFAVSLQMLKTIPRPAIASVTDADPTTGSL